MAAFVPLKWNMATVSRFLMLFCTDFIVIKCTSLQTDLLLLHLHLIYHVMEPLRLLKDFIYGAIKILHFAHF